MAFRVKAHEITAAVAALPPPDPGTRWSSLGLVVHEADVALALAALNERFPALFFSARKTTTAQKYGDPEQGIWVRMPSPTPTKEP